MLIGIQWLGSALVFLSELRSPTVGMSSMVITACVVLMYGGLLIAYWRGWVLAAPLSVAFLSLVVVTTVPEPYLTEQAPQVILIPSILAFVLGGPLWTVGCATFIWAGLLIRAGGVGVYALPAAFAIYVMIIGGLYFNQLVSESNQRLAEEKARQAEAQANQLVQQSEERRRIEDALRQSEARFRALIQNSSDVVMLMHKDGTVVYVSPSVTRMLGYAPAEAMGRNGAEFVHVEDRARTQHFFRSVARNAGRVYTVNIRIRHHNGSWRWHEEIGTNLLDDQAVKAIVINSRDIHERYMAEQMLRENNESLERHVQQRTAQLEESNHELEAFSYSVSHDLRAPLRSINGFTRILIEDYNSSLPAEALHYLQRVSSGAAQMGDLIDDLLSFSRLSRQPVYKKRVITVELAQRVIEDLQPDYEGRQVNFTVGELPDCQADPTLLRQVFINLLSNAVKFSRSREAARIEVGCETGEIPVYFVRDNGVGFDPQYQDKLFNVFQRLHSDTYEGTGVGLAIVQRIVKRHGGRVWASTQPEQGATFYFTLAS